MVASVLRSATLLLLLASTEAQAANIAVTEPNTAAQWSALGDRRFREARFDDAETAWSKALALDTRNIEAHLGLGKVALLLSDKPRAASHFSAAYQIAPRDPDAILAFAEIVPGHDAKQTLLRNFLSYAHDGRTEDVAGRLRIVEQTGAVGSAVLSSPYISYQIPLSSLTGGLVLRARFGSGRELKLIVDTGAAGIVLNSSAAAETKLQFLGDSALLGYGSAKPLEARSALADSFQTGSLKIASVLLNVSNTDITSDADGFIGLDVFKDFLIRLDARARTLDLTPFADHTATACEDCIRAYRVGTLLLLQGTINGRTLGYFILDSGSPCSMVSNKLVSSSGRIDVFNGAQGALSVNKPASPVTIRLGAKPFMDFDYAIFDSAAISERNGVEIAGAIGYSLLRNLALTIDYRNGFVKLDTP